MHDSYTLERELCVPYSETMPKDIGTRELTLYICVHAAMNMYSYIVSVATA